MSLKVLPTRGVPIYTSASAFGTGSQGELAVAQDTNTLYEFNGTTWVPIASAGGFTAVADTNSVDLTVNTGTVSADLNYQDTNEINLDVDANGLKANLNYVDTNTVDIGVGASGLSANVRYQDSNTVNLSDDTSGLKADVLISATGVASSAHFKADLLEKDDGLFVEVADSDITSRVLTGYVAASGSVVNTDTIEQSVEKLGWNVDNTNDIYTDTKEPSGFVDPDNISIAYSHTDRKVTLTHPSGSIVTRYRGVKSTVASPWQSSAHDAASGSWFLSAAGPITGATWDQNPWTFDKIQISTGNYNSAATGSFFLRECHGFMQWQSHQEDHETIGTYWQSGLGLTAGTYVVYTASTAPTNVADNTYGIDAGVIKDEDVPSSVSAWAQGTYTTAYRSGATGEWVFDTTASLPYFVGTNTLQWNQNTGSTWQLTVASEDNYVNVFDYAFPVTTDADSQKYAHVQITGQGQFTTLAAAQQEFPENLDLGTLTGLSPEFVCVNRITYQFNAVGPGAVGAGVSGRCKIMAVTPIRGTRASQVAVAGAAPSDHGNLSGLADDDHTQYELISGRAGNVVTQSTDFTQDSSVILYVVDTTGGSKTVTLLDPTTVPGKLVTFLNNSTNNVTFAGYAIGGISNFTIDGAERIQLVSDGTVWKQYARKAMATWKTGVTFCKDQLIEVTASGYEGLWRCTTTHTASAAFSTDIANWDLIPATYTENNASNTSGSPDVSNYSAFASAATGTSATFTFDARGAIEFLLDVNTDGGMTIACDYKSTVINALSDPSGLFLATDAGTGIYISKSANSSVVTVKNRLAATKTIGVLAVRSKITAATAWS